MSLKSKENIGIKPCTRILLVGPLPPPVGGTTTSFYELVEGISSDTSINTFVINVSRSQQKSLLANFVIGMSCLIRSVVKIPLVDVVALNLSNEGFLVFGTLISYVCKLFNIPILFRVFGGSLDIYWENCGILKQAFLRRLFHSGNILLQTKLLTDYFSVKFPEAKIHWFSNSRVIQEIGSEPKYFQKFRFIYIGRIDSKKGIFEIIEASKKCDPTSVEIHLFGPLVGNITLADFDANPIITYKGIVPYDQIYETLQEYDTLLLPTYYEGEGYPGVILEALVCGVPVISTLWRSIPEIITHESNGILVPPKDIPLLCQSMLRLVNDRVFFQKLKMEAIKTASRFDNKIWNKRYVKHCLNAIVNKKI
ncbi:glycosyl transferase, group 1 family protein [Candidatus Scalindua japonica]|uniref:Glycosyl transferase, group 1 family protein n=1 Tax=Candidatus Scalindua japonica TaxID=1284222 RepID=A0A286U4E0_9BACT|nr:glycosyltransferase [Candidatus Scalindua japonica]GAX62931.1 glycosyl transferase, group 1 family protein [Candidatus Scalindua japonica]